MNQDFSEKQERSTSFKSSRTSFIGISLPNFKDFSFRNRNLTDETDEIEDNTDIMNSGIPYNIDTGIPCQSHGATTLQTVANISNSMVGAGSLMIPYAISCCGLIGGVILLILFGIISRFTLLLYVYSSVYAKRFSMRLCVEKFFGVRMSKYSDFTIAIYCLLGLTTYTIIIKDYLFSIMTLIFGETNKTLMLLLAGAVILCCCLPLMCMKDIKSLSFTSTLSVGCISFIVLVIIFKFFSNIDHLAIDNIKMFEFSLKFVEGTPGIIFGFFAHFTVAPIYKDLQRRSFDKIRSASAIGILIPGLVYTLIGVCGYLVFGANVADNILNSFSNNDPLIVVCRVAMISIILFTYPMFAYSCRLSIEGAFSKRVANSSRHNTGTVVVSSGFRKRLFISLFIIITCVILAYFLKNISLVTSLAGATISPFYFFQLPCLMHLKAHKMAKIRSKKLKTKPYVWQCYSLIVLGFFVEIFGLYQWFKNLQ
eukprot:TRINITY_DN2461_c1_g4_i1.p1 TRINITY_DN2461_c1_g4~~TRINITY_DN2461_c1_g4_i1.p1  ORF type:complete len:481 (-),score=78.81 TRINITY_DN2461_c1_g4_i1:174-1616(-)